MAALATALSLAAERLTSSSQETLRVRLVAPLEQRVVAFQKANGDCRRGRAARELEKIDANGSLRGASISTRIPSIGCLRCVLNNLTFLPNRLRAARAGLSTCDRASQVPEWSFQKRG